MSPVEVLAERADDLARQALRLRALSRTRPHVFLEDKEELARDIFRFGADLRKLGRQPVQSATFSAGPVAIRGRTIAVERRARS